MKVPVLVLLNEGEMFRPYMPGEPLVEAARLEIDPPFYDGSHDMALDLAEVVYAICNSYPEEMFCAPRHADQVAVYRDGRNRSLSVGDVVVIGEGPALAVDRFGFKVLEEIPVFRAREEA